MNYEHLRQTLNHISPLGEEEWEDFCSELYLENKASGDLILRQGQVRDFVGFLNSGAVRVYEIIDGVEMNRTFFLQGFFATEYKSFLSDTPSEEFIETISDAELVIIRRELLNKMYDRYKSFERLGRKLSESLYIKMREKLERYQVKTPEERYKEMMTSNPNYIDLIPHYHIASYLGITPQSLSRIRKRLKTSVSLT